MRVGLRSNKQSSFKYDEYPNQFYDQQFNIEH